MTRQEKLDLLLSKVPEDQKEAFVAELREAKTKEDRLGVAKKYNALLTEEEVKKFLPEGTKLSDEELDEAAGGCCSSSCSSAKCSCTCTCS